MLFLDGHLHDPATARLLARDDTPTRPRDPRNGPRLPIDKRSRDWRTPIELLMLAAIWGGSFLFLRIASPEFGPVPLVEVRLALGALVLLPFLWRERARFPLARWPQLAAIGLVNTLIPFLLFAWSAERAPAGVSAIVNSMAVPFAALAAFAMFGERIGGRRLTGLVGGLVGVAMLASGELAGASLGPAVAAGALAALFYGVSANLVKRHLADLPPIAVAAATLACGAVLLAPLAASTWPSTPVSMEAWSSLVAIGVVCTGFAYAVYFRLIQRVGAPRATTVTYLVPMFGVLWAWLALGEPLTLNMGAGGALILGGMLFGQMRDRRTQRESRRALVQPAAQASMDCHG
jgi:drug/metabolite transporter (DMT)-like permease